MAAHHHCFSTGLGLLQGQFGPTVSSWQLLPGCETGSRLTVASHRVVPWGKGDQIKCRLVKFDLFGVFFSSKKKGIFTEMTTVRVLMLGPPHQHWWCFVQGQSLVAFHVLNPTSSRRPKVQESLNMKRFALARSARTRAAFCLS